MPYNFFTYCKSNWKKNLKHVLYRSSDFVFTTLIKNKANTLVTYKGRIDGRIVTFKIQNYMHYIPVLGICNEPWKKKQDDYFSSHF